MCLHKKIPRTLVYSGCWKHTMFFEQSVAFTLAWRHEYWETCFTQPCAKQLTQRKWKTLVFPELCGGPEVHVVTWSVVFSPQHVPLCGSCCSYSTIHMAGSFYRKDNRILAPIGSGDCLWVMGEQWNDNANRVGVISGDMAISTL